MRSPALAENPRSLGVAQRTVHSRNHGLQSRTGRRVVHTNTPQHARIHGGLNVAGSVRGRGGRHRVLGVIHHANIHALTREDVLQSIHRAGTRCGAVVGVTVNVQGHAQGGRTGIGRINVDRLDTVLTPALLGIGGGQVLVREDIPQLLAGHLAALGIGASLNNLRELHLRTARPYRPYRTASSRE